MVEYVEVPLPEDFPTRIIEVTRLEIGDVVQPNREPQIVRDVGIIDEHRMRIRLSGEQSKIVSSGTLWALIRRKDEK